jgi:monoamine oxidase
MLSVCTAGPLQAISAIMKRFSRRSFLAAAAAVVAPAAMAQTKKAGPAPKEPQRPINPDVVIVGAGAAGIAAARRLAAAGKRYALIEAANLVGGRCITDTATFGVPYDRGAHWIHTPDLNPIAKLGPETKLDIYPAPPGQRMRIGHRYAREAEMEEYLAQMVRASTAIGDASRKGDVPCALALPKDLGSWRATIEFVLGPFGCGKDLAEISAADFARSLERDIDALCRQGLGALLAKLANGLTVELGNPVTRINYGSRPGVQVSTTRGDLDCRAVIVTISTNLIAAGRIKFTPDLPKRHLDAAAKLKLGSYDHIALELLGNPLGLRPDELVFEKCDSNRTASIFGNVSGTSLCLIDVAGSFGRDLAAKGDAAMIDFAQSWLGNLYGTDIAKSLGRRHATHWNDEPLALGAFSAAAPGAQGSRRVLMEQVNDRVFFAGEAVHETLWGTVGGAWESGERAADAVIKALSGKKGA